MTRKPAAAKALPPAPAGSDSSSSARPGAQFAVLPIADLVPNPRNPRKHPADQLTMLQASLTRDGQTKPVLARAANRMLIAGHGITLAAKAIGMASLQVLLWDVDQATADRVMLADNRLGELSSNDKGRVAELLSELDPQDIVATGFSADEVSKIMASFDDVLDVVEIETGPVADDFWITCRGPLAMQAVVLDRIKQLLAEYPGVAIELGTVAAP